MGAGHASTTKSWVWQPTQPADAISLVARISSGLCLRTAKCLGHPLCIPVLVRLESCYSAKLSAFCFLLWLAQVSDPTGMEWARLWVQQFIGWVYWSIIHRLFPEFLTQSLWLDELVAAEAIWQSFSFPTVSNPARCRSIFCSHSDYLWGLAMPGINLNASESSSLNAEISGFSSYLYITWCPAWDRFLTLHRTTWCNTEGKEWTQMTHS